MHSPPAKIRRFVFDVTIGAALFQAALILYKHYVGYVVQSGLGSFLMSWLFSTALTAPALAAIILFDLWGIYQLEKRFSWADVFWKRLFYELVLAIVTGALLALAVTFVSEWLASYEEPFHQVVLYNIIIGAVTNLVITSVVEATRFYRQHQHEKKQRETLQHENIELRYQTLKKQLDPHFLFNSLNVLSSLVRTDRKRAQDFINEFSAVYRYALDAIERPLVTVKEELDFAESYLFLQNIRFQDAVRVHIAVDERALTWLVPSLAVQTLLENAFKHNVVAESRPLTIRLYSENNALFVVNSRQPKKHPSPGKGIGFANLKSRYALISDAIPDVMMTDQEYIVKLPLFQAD